MHAVVLEKFFLPIITYLYICIFIVPFLPLIWKDLTLFMHKTELLFGWKTICTDLRILEKSYLKGENFKNRQTEWQTDKLATGEQNSSPEL